MFKNFILKKFSFFVLTILITSCCSAQEQFWKFENERSISKKNTPRLIVPKIGRVLSLSFDSYKNLLNTAPAESFSAIKKGIEISLPYPDNSFKKFRIVETKIMEEGLAAQFPQIKTYTGRGIDDPTAKVVIDYTTQGFHACVTSPEGALYIDPYQKANNDLYISYFSKDYVNSVKEKFKCTFNEQLNRNAGSLSPAAPLSGTCIGTQLRTYRIAISCTGEYAIAVCPAGNVTVANTLSAIVTTLNRVNGVYQTQLDIKLVLVAADNLVVYTNPATDPYTGNNNGDTLIVQSQANITSVLGSAAFDIGHTFSTGGGGLASLGVACSSGNKASGITGFYDPTGDAYDIDYVAHEIGHQFGATHPFESEMGNCGGGNRSKGSAFEPGSGTTIMGYAGICGSDNIQPNSDPYFHTKSFDQIVTYTTTGGGNACPTVTTIVNSNTLSNNNIPVVTMPASGVKIPKGTPFTLSGSAADADGDALTYSWEEWDLTNSNSGSEWDSGAYSTVRPLFKTRIPKTTGSRTFPDMAVILANYPQNPIEAMDGLKGETLPQVARDIKFRLVARDNNASGGGVATGGSGCSSLASFKVVVTDDGPFVITAPNTAAVNWLGGSTHTVTWNVANTNDATGINVQNVDILMSTDGGTTYPMVIASNTPNDGTQTITVPNIMTNNAVRFMVKAVGNIFFDISDADFTVTFNSVLPVSLLEFSAKANSSAILLSWSTANELNNKGFEVLRSEGSENNFVTISFIKSAGNSNTIHNYSLNDNAVKKGVIYFYRLRQIDLNNISLYSEIKKAKIDLQKILSASIQPQPFYDYANLSLRAIDKKDFKIIISDVTGRIIIRKEIKNTEETRLIPLDFNGRASGVYFIKILQTNIIATIKAVKH